MALKTRGFSHHQQIAARRERTLILVSQGRNASEICAELGVGESTTRRDISYLTEMAKTDIKSYVEDRLPWEYTKSLAVLDSIKKEAFQIAHKDYISDRDRIMALRLAAEVETSKARLLAEGPGVIAMQNIQERIDKLESQRFHEKLQEHSQIAR